MMSQVIPYATLQAGHAGGFERIVHTEAGGKAEPESPSARNCRLCSDDNGQHACRTPINDHPPGLQVR